ncbi:MAG: ComEC/Rec2 family competence protein [Victivallales bacterium]|jgi:ComEC/Rec2-related protein|nr:ComEC/Rec2 family competence protein [Victivallales bacterium]
MIFPLLAKLNVSAPVAWFVGIVGGTLPAVLLGNSIFYIFTTAITVGAISFLLLQRRFAVVVAAGLLSGIGGIGFHQLKSGYQDNYAAMLPMRNCGATAQLRIVDPRISEVSDIAPPSLIRAQVLNFRLSGETEFRPSSGVIYLKLPKKIPPELRCGDIILGDGVFALPNTSDVFLWHETDSPLERLEPMRDFSTYLLARGACRTFKINQCAVIGYKPGVIGKITLCRDWLLKRAVSEISKVEIRNLIAALFFGTSGGVDTSSRLRLIESGTIHLFSVSGMHVAMLTAVLLLFLRPLPLRIRYITLFAMLLLYTLSTGANAPAMRAFYMIGLWCLLRAALLYIPSLQTLLLAGGTLILASPYIILDMGFQYSFIITAILILAGERFEQASELLGEEFRYMPNSPFKRMREKRLRRAWSLFFAIGACCAAFVGGVGLSLYTQGLLLPGSILANLILMPIVALLFPVLFFKLATGALYSGFDWFGAKLLEWCFSFTDTITRLFANGFERLSAIRPSLIEILLFYSALFWLLTTRRIRYAAFALAVLLLFPLSWLYRAEKSPLAFFVATNNMADDPIIALHDPKSDYTLMVNAAGFDSSIAGAEFLQKRGATQIDRIIFSSARTGNLTSLAQLSARLPIEEAFTAKLDRHAWAFRNKFAETLPECPLKTSEGGGDYGLAKIIPQKNGFELAYSNLRTTFQIRLLLEMFDNGWLVTLQSSNGKSERRMLSNSSVPEVWVYEFK